MVILRFGVCILALSACNSAADMFETAGTTGEASSSNEVSPTTAGELLSTSGEASTSGGETTTGEEEPSTGAAARPSCIEYGNANACAAAPECRWASVIAFGFGIHGCQGDVVQRCVPQDEGVASTWYRGGPGDYEVVRFEDVPQDFPEEWRPCDCDGPLACFCAADAPDCPDRMQDFCGGVGVQTSCESAAVRGELRCAWLKVTPEGPKDDACTQQSFRQTCLAVDDPTSHTCEKFAPPYPQCGVAMPPVYWRERDGVLETVTACGPVPPAPEWTACGPVDTPEQPDECGCSCL